MVPIAATGEDAAPQPSAANAPFRLDTDIAVYWRQAEAEPARVDMVAYKPDSAGRGTFMLTLTPGMDLKPIVEGRDWVFVLDRSGSMSGKIATLAEGVSRTLGQLRPEDRFRIVYFNDQAAELTNGFTPGHAGDGRASHRMGAATSRRKAAPTSSPASKWASTRSMPTVPAR